ncbi:hypothetical protein [Enterococcus sp. UD-01]|jgi:hypothetical protein
MAEALSGILGKESAKEFLLLEEDKQDVDRKTTLANINSIKSFIY